MSSLSILPGQFYLAEPDDQGRCYGWTVKAVEAAKVNDETKERALVRVWAIRNDVRTAAPELFSYQEIAYRISEGLWKKVSGPVKPEVQLEVLDEDSQKKVKSVEAARLKLIEPLLALGNDAFWKHIRRPALARRAEETGKTVDYLWQLWCLYWQFDGPRGLRPRCFLAGQKPLQKRVECAAKAAEAARKADPKCKATGADFFKPYKTGRKQAPNVTEGKLMQWADIQTCRRGARKFLFVPSPDNKLRYNYSEAYACTLDVLYGYKESDARVVEIPSRDQFIAAVESDPSFPKLSARIVGAFAMMRDHRPKKGTTQYEVLGPGHVLQVDDVSGKVILVHSLTLLPIGIGNIFAGIDQWSKLIAGGHVTLQGSSFEGVKELFVNVATPKQKFFEDQGIDVDPKYFPAHGVFRYVCPDKGPLGADLGNIVAREFCNMSNPGSHRPDMKSDIESSFHAYLRQHAEHLPGYNRVERRNGNEDPNVIACLTPREFMALWWQWAAEYNARVIDSFLPIEALHQNHEPRPENRPFALWNWGMNNISAYIREATEDEVRRALLHEETGTLTPRNGIKLFKLRYFVDGEAPIRIQSIQVKIRYSSIYLKRIYVFLDGKWVTASLNEEDARKFGDLTVGEMLAEKKDREQSDRGGQSDKLKVRVGNIRARRHAVDKSRANITAMFPDPKFHRQLVKSMPTGLNRSSAIRIEQSDTRRSEEKAFPLPNHQTAGPKPTLKRLTRAQLLNKQ